MNIKTLLQKAKIQEPIRREFAVEAKVLDETAGTVQFVASDETLDCYQEIVRVGGWRFTHFSKNAPFVDSHNYGTITNLLGQVTDWKIEGGKLLETVRYSREPGTLADWAFKMVRDGFLKAVSVGFIPVRMATKWDATPAEFVNAIAEMKLDAATAAKLKVVYLEQEQIELSQCVIGANPNALTLAKAYKAGCLTEQDLTGISALHAKSKTAPSADNPAGVEVAHRRAKLALLAGIQSHL